MITGAGLRRALAALAPFYWLVLVGACAWKTSNDLRAGTFALDYRGTIWLAGKAILHGHSPYPAADVARLAHIGNPAVYPAPTLLVTAPLALIPLKASAILWDVGSLAALVAAFWLVGVRDRRVYAVVLLSFPVVFSLVLAQLDAVLALGCALVWRWRRAPGARFPLALALVVAAKVLLWPLLVWAVVIGRRRAAVVAAVTGAVLTAAAWAVVGFHSLVTYPHLLSSLSYAFGTKGYSLMAFGSRLGLAPASARVLPLVALVALCVLSVWLARTGRPTDAFVAAVAAGIVGSPILWLHYLGILFVALAIKRPRFGWAWALPIVFWLSPTENPPSAFFFGVGLAAIAALVAVGIWPRRLRAPLPTVTTTEAVAA